MLILQMRRLRYKEFKEPAVVGGGAETGTLVSTDHVFLVSQKALGRTL